MFQTMFGSAKSKKINYGLARVSASAYALLAGLLCVVYQQALARDVSATNCEVFVDKLQVTQDNQTNTNFSVYLKLVSHRLVGAVQQVGVYHKRNETTTGDANSSAVSAAGENGFVYDVVPAFEGSNDYYRFSTILENNWRPATETVAFFVDTSAGNRYWVNRGNVIGENFVFGAEMVMNLSRSPDGYYRSDRVKAFAWDVDSLQQTADYPSDLAAIFNPKRCR